MIRKLYEQFRKEPVNLLLKPRIEIDDTAAPIYTATLHCLDCMAVIDKATASSAALAGRTLARRQENRQHPLTHCPGCADHAELVDVDEATLREIAPDVVLAIAEAQDEVTAWHGRCM